VSRTRVIVQRRRAMPWPLVAIAVLCVGSVLGTWRVLQGTQEALGAAHISANLMFADLQQIHDLRSAQQVVEIGERPAQDLIARVNDCLDRASLSHRHFVELLPAGDRAVSTGSTSERSRYREQSTQLRLDNLTPRQFGQFLQYWPEAAPAWVPTRIDMTHERGRERDSNAYTITIVMTAIYLSNDMGTTEGQR